MPTQTHKMVALLSDFTCLQLRLFFPQKHLKITCLGIKWQHAELSFGAYRLTIKALGLAHLWWSVLLIFVRSLFQPYEHQSYEIFEGSSQLVKQVDAAAVASLSNVLPNSTVQCLCPNTSYSVLSHNDSGLIAKLTWTFTVSWQSPNVWTHNNLPKPDNQGEQSQT